MAFIRFIMMPEDSKGRGTTGVNTDLNPSEPDVTFDDARIQPDARTVPTDVISAYHLDVHRVEPLETTSFNIHFRLDTNQGLFDLRRSNWPNDGGTHGRTRTADRPTPGLI